VACVAGIGLGIDHGHWAMTAAAVPLAIVTAGEEPDLRAVLDRAAHRIAGTFVGLAVTPAVLLPEPRPAVLALVVMALLFPTELASPSDPVDLLLARGIDTLIGVAAGVAAAALVRGRLPALELSR
jgi:uncharacterized membrane protein YccC